MILCCFMTVEQHVKSALQSSMTVEVNWYAPTIQFTPSCINVLSNKLNVDLEIEQNQMLHVRQRRQRNKCKRVHTTLCITLYTSPYHINTHISIHTSLHTLHYIHITTYTSACFDVSCMYVYVAMYMVVVYLNAILLLVCVCS